MTPQDWNEKVYETMFREWPQVEQNIRAIVNSGQFSDFLKSFEQKRLLEQSSEADDFVSAIENLFKVSLQNTSKPNDQCLTFLERKFNLAFYLSCRNLQTCIQDVVDFCSIEDYSLPIPNPWGEEISLRFTFEGCCFEAPNKSDEIPQSDSISSLFSFPLPNTSVESLEEVLSEIRNAMHEVFVLVDEWEYKNTRFAAYQLDSRKKFGPQSNEFKNILAGLALNRDALALWALESFIDFQSWVSQLRGKSLPPDLEDEVAAMDALLLSAVQKVFLPAAVSRHKYSLHVVALIEHWCKARMQYHRDCVSTQILSLGCQLALGHLPTLKSPSFLSEKTFEWKLGFDPVAPLKSIAWMLSEKTYLWLVTLCFIAVNRKVSPNPLSSTLLLSFATALEMRESYQHPFANNGEVEMEDAVIQKCIAEALAALQRIKHSEEDDDSLEFIERSLQALEEETLKR